MAQLDTLLPAMKPAARLRSAAPYAELKRRVKDAGLLDTQPVYYVFKLMIVLVLYLAGFAVLFLTDNTIIILLDAVYLGFIFQQTSGLAHDIAHRQISRDIRRVMTLSVFYGDLMQGMSYDWWYPKHTAHHSHPNDVDHDPDVNFPVIAFTEKQAHEKRGVFRWIVQRQAKLLFPMMSFEAYNMRFHAVRVLVQGSDNRWTELPVIALHYVWYLTLVFTQLSVWQGIAFIAVHHAVWSICLGLIFAPNHKGMPYQDENTQFDFLEAQVLTSRNVVGHPVTDFFYNGLNYQIEHHLFPTMPRNQLCKARPIVKDFCAEQGIDYYETGIWQAHREFIEHLEEISAVIRDK